MDGGASANGPSRFEACKAAARGRPRHRRVSSAARRACSDLCAGESARPPGGRMRRGACVAAVRERSGAASAPAPAAVRGGRTRRVRRTSFQGLPDCEVGRLRAGRGGGHHREHRGQRQGRAQGCAAPHAVRPPGAPRPRAAPGARGPRLRALGRPALRRVPSASPRTRQALAPAGLSGRQSPAPRRTTGTAAGTPARHARLSWSPPLAIRPRAAGSRLGLNCPGPYPNQP